MSRLIIAEKPSVARAIVDALPGSAIKEDGYTTVGNTIVTWCFGHILELAPPKFYNPDWEKWNASHLPYRVKEFKLLPKPDAAKQLKLIGNLLKNSTEVVNAGDPDREGQMLVDEVLEYYGWKGATKRMLLNSTDEESVKAALRDLKNNRDYYWLFQSAKCRSYADWLVGMSLTVGATKLLANDDLVSVGRVQTPTLALLVKRDLEIENFVPKEFWTLVAKVKAQGGTIVELKHEPQDEQRIFDKKVAQAIADQIQGASVKLSVRVLNKKEAPPRPYSLLTFSKDAGKRYGWSAQKSLDILQKLYEPEFGLTTYPRTNCDYLKDEHRDAVPKIVANIIGSGFYDQVKPLSGKTVIRNSVFNSKKVEEHHAIIPTTKKPGSNLSGDYLKGWQLVVERFLMSILPDFEFKETSIWFGWADNDEDRIFGAKGVTPLNTKESWRLFDPKKESSVPDIKDGTQGTVESCVPTRGETTPPKRYTEPDLMVDMAAVAKFVEDPRIKEKLKETSGIGTAATRANILETLKKRGYAEVKAKNIISTPFGRSFIAAVPSMLKDPGMTALWEDALDRIAKNDYPPEEFMEKINVFVSKRIEDMRKASGSVVIQGLKKTESARPARKGGKSASSTSGRAPSTRGQSTRSRTK